MNCPLCRSASKFAFEAKGFPIHDCLKCGHRFAAVSPAETHVTEVYDDSYFTNGGAGYTDYLAEGEMLAERGYDYGKTLSKYAAPSRILDVGAAAGFILKGFYKAGWNGMGIEPNERMARYGRETLNLEILPGDLENFAATEKFAAISMIQVVAHLHDPRRAFQNAANLLKEDGLLLIETWNRSSLTARLFRTYWHEYSPPSVLHWFSPESLSAFLAEFGFEEKAFGKPSKKISGEHAKSLLRYRLGDKFNPLLRLIPSKINFPYPSEDLFWAVYQKK